MSMWDRFIIATSNKCKNRIGFHRSQRYDETPSLPSPIHGIVDCCATLSNVR